MKKQYDFKISEKKWQKFWEKEKIFKFNPKKKGKLFSIDTPPPTLSGKMHIGHAFSYTHQDIIARYHRMKGENVFYPFGVDNNGLPSEKLVEKLNKVKIFDLGRKKFVQLCQKTLKKILPEFISDWKRIGMSCDFSLFYSTISPEVQKLSQKYFLDLFKKNRIYRKETPTLWCPECQTAIAQAELEDKEEEILFNDIEFSLEDGGKIIISTTRPELLPSCVAIFVHPKDKRYRKFIGKKAIVPIFGQKVKIMPDSKVDIKKGSGVVMCCTFGDTTDIEWYFKHKLPLRISITKDGRMNELAKEFQGLPIEIARKKIIERLKNEGLIKNQKKIIHSVNVHERCGHKIEILSTPQWFIKYLDLRQEFLKQSSKLHWYPKHMKSRLDNWIKGLRWDWCISRQRYFGIPIPVWYCQNCKKIILPDEKDLPVDPLHQKPKKKCSCGSNKFIPESDVLDTWVTSSLTPQIAFSLLGKNVSRSKMLPMSLRPQAHDIINFWLFYTLVRSYLHFKKIPWKDVVISGFVLDPKGEKMSKSKGNVVEPQIIIEKYGADAIRYWAASARLGEDLRYSEEEIKQGKRTVTKLWNASRFSLMHLKRYSPKKISPQGLEDEDKWLLTKLYRTLRDYRNFMDKYEYSKAKETLDKFFWRDFCDNYLEIIKPRVYNPESSQKLKSAQFTLYTSLLSILKLYAPFMPFVTEEIYQMYFRKFEKEKSIHITLLPKPNKKLYFPRTAHNFEFVIEAIAQIRKYKSEHKLPMNAEIQEVSIKTKNKKLLEKYFPLLQRVLNVKRIKY
ncbi:valine--tRNA ligase [bacterium]|nr:valine--tRNA ligase [bacterium]